MANDLHLKPGTQTSEYAVARSNNWISILVSVVGLITAAGSAVVEAIGTDSKIGIVVGAILAVLGIVTKTLTDLGYIKSRTEVKAAALLADEAQAQARQAALQ